MNGFDERRRIHLPFYGWNSVRWSNWRHNGKAGWNFPLSISPALSVFRETWMGIWSFLWHFIEGGSCPSKSPSRPVGIAAEVRISMPCEPHFPAFAMDAALRPIPISWKSRDAILPKTGYSQRGCTVAFGSVPAVSTSS